MSQYPHSSQPNHSSTQIVISGIPAENGKCRVETQLKIGFHLRNHQGEASMKWKQIRLPRSLIAKEKHRMEKFNGRDKNTPDSEILTLETRLVCDHDMTKLLECCDNCIGRERKRAHRRKESQRLPGPLSSIPVFGAVNRKSLSMAAALACESNPPTPTEPIAYQQWERSRIMVFSSTEYVDISTGECILPLRITCYCRHHNEKVGFRIQFTARDFTGALVASVLTNPVMMMDDHKSGKRATPAEKVSTKEPSKSSSSLSTPLSTVTNSNRRDSQDDMDDDDYTLDEQDDLDYEDDINSNNYRENNFSFPSTRRSSYESTTRVAPKRRVIDEDYAMEDIQMHQQTFRRKTSHDTQFTSTTSGFEYSCVDQDSSVLSPSPFMPGSPYAKDEEYKTFVPQFGQAIVMPNGEVLSQYQIQQQIGALSANQDPMNTDSASLLGNFTTLEEAQSSTLSFDLNTPLSENNSYLNRPSISVPLTPQASTPLYQSISSFQSSFPSPPDSDGDEISPSFLNMLQMHEFQEFQRQDSVQRQQQILMQLLHQQQQQQQQQQHEQEKAKVHWITPEAEKNDPFRNYRASSNPSPEAFMPIPASLPDDIGAEYSLDGPAHGFGFSGDNSNLSQLPKRRGRPRKIQTNVGASTPSYSAVTPISAASSPIVSPKPPSAILPSSPSPPPYATRESIVSTPILSSANLAECVSSSSSNSQFLLLHQHQQQLQQQQKQAILARQSNTQNQKNSSIQSKPPRLLKLIPAKGSIEGGDEITMLGSGFYPGMVPTFDGVPAHNVEYYGPETIICRLPPRAHPGLVVVKACQHHQGNTLLSDGLKAIISPKSSPSLKAIDEEPSSPQQQSSELVCSMNKIFGGSSAASLSMPIDYNDRDDHTEDVGAIFEYQEDRGDSDLIALALQVLGLKMVGRIEHPQQVAMRIMATASAHQQIVEQQQQQQQQQQQLQQLQLQLQRQQQARQQTPRNAIMGVPSGTLTALTNTTKTTKSMSATMSSRASSSTLTPIPLHSPQSLQTESFLKTNTTLRF